MELKAHKKGRFWILGKKHFGRRTGAFGRRVSNQKESFSFVKNRAPNRRIRAPIWCFAGRIFVTSGTDSGAWGPIFTGLYIEKCIFRIRVHKFWDLRHILEQKLCRFGGQPS